MMPRLFQPLKLRGLTLPNRIVISPMCQYSADDGQMNEWHMAHLAQMSLSGAGLLILEATAVVPEGRISANDAGLYDDACEAAMARILSFIRKVSTIPLGIQIGHAGRKASTRRPWEGRAGLPEAEGGWQTFAPSALPYAKDWPEPLAMTTAQIDDLVAAFVATAKRADRLGFDYLELHCAHGYLLSSFLSPLSNRRDDDYGGSPENRMRLPLRIARELRKVWPADKPLGAKVNGSDFVEGGWTATDAATLAGELKQAGVDMVTVSGGGVDPAQQINVEAGYQVPFAEEVRKASGVTTAAVGMIVRPEQAEEILATEKADLVALARAMLFDPHWPRHAAAALGAEIPYPPQYERASPANWPGIELVRTAESGG